MLWRKNKKAKKHQTKGNDTTTKQSPDREIFIDGERYIVGTRKLDKPIRPL